MRRRPIVGLALWIAIVLAAASPAHASITAFWQQVTITPEGIANDPALANMQSWDLMTTTTGNWQAAGLRAVLPAGSFFYKHPLGGFKKPSPSAVADHPALAFTPYVNTPNDNGLNNSNTFLLGGYEDEQMSIGDITAPLPGVFSVTWADLFADPPGTYQIARLTFPNGLLPNIVDNRPRPFTSQITPDSSTLIPDIPEPGTAAWVSAAGLLALRRRSPRRRASCLAACEPLEGRRLLSFAASFPAGATLAPRTDVNASNSPAVTEGEAVVVVSPTDPLKVATFAVEATTFHTDTVWWSSNGGSSYMPSTVPK